MRIGQADAGIGYRKVNQGLPIQQGFERHRQDDLACVGELDGVIDVVDQHLAQAQGVSHQHGWQVGIHLAQQLQVFGPGFFGDHTQDIGNHRFQLKRHALHIELAGFNFGEVENVVDQAQQMLAGALDFDEVVALPWRGGIPQGQARQANDGVHRRAYFMAHIGQEIAFGKRCFFSLFQSLQHAAFGIFQQSDIHHPAHQGGFAIVVNLGQGQQHVAHAAIGCVELGRYGDQRTLVWRL